MTELPTAAREWEECFAASPSESTRHSQWLLQRDHLRPLVPLLPPGARILEAGCGLGQYVHAFASLGHRCTGLDFSLPLLLRAQQRGALLNSSQRHPEWTNGNILSLSLKNGALDCYSSFGVLEHFVEQQQRQILREAFRVLKPGGIFYQYVPNFWSPWTLRRELRYWYRRFVPPTLVWQRNMRRSTLRSFCADAGFREVFCGSVYAEVALTALAPPPFLRRYVPAGLRKGAAQITEQLGDWCDHHNMMGYGLVFIGRKPKPPGSFAAALKPDLTA